MKHTPGPWRAFGDSLTVHSIDTGMIYNATNMIATVSALGDSQMELANTCLIGAAPELLGELEIAVDVIKSFIEDSPEAITEPIQALLSSMDNVIRKAKGENHG